MAIITVPYEYVHKAASAVKKDQDVAVTKEMFHEAYRGWVEDNKGLTEYVIPFDTDEDATMFILKWT